SAARRSTTATCANSSGPNDRARLGQAAMQEPEYLVRYGLNGEFGRFRSARPLSCQRGEAVIVRTGRGLELGHVLRPAMPGHATFLPNTTVGTLLRQATPDDEQSSVRMRRRGEQILGRGRELIAEGGLP